MENTARELRVNVFRVRSKKNAQYQSISLHFCQSQPLREFVALETRTTAKITLWSNFTAVGDMNRQLSAATTTYAEPCSSDIIPSVYLECQREALPTGYLAAVTPALESALANAHEAGHQSAVRILHAVLAILDDPRLR
jgi:hypothetical protein